MTSTTGTTGVTHGMAAGDNTLALLIGYLTGASSAMPLRTCLLGNSAQHWPACSCSMVSRDLEVLFWVVEMLLSKLLFDIGLLFKVDLPAENCTGIVAAVPFGTRSTT